ncbi:MAG: tRNA lysidine(34) synthetase TilS [Clostridia bacterium]|nr:tRNA lysidine(34) synthetase TilS [Clostridia bacterium]
MELEKAFKTIEENKMFQPGCVVGVACSGGSDSMALLHFLNTNREKLDIEVVAIHVDHNTRANDVRDALFVADYCKENRIRFHKFKVEGKVIAKKKKMTLEEACREGRYNVFKSLKERGIVDVMAIAHQQSDQAETVLLHILRGSGLSGASGMDYVREDYYVRPFLDVSKQEILSYVYENEIPYVEDETNVENFFSRNILRNKVFPELRMVWPTVDENLCNFAKICKEDDKAIRSLMNFDAVIYGSQNIKIPVSYFLYSMAQVSRLLFECFQKLGVSSNIEHRHISLISKLAISGENGAKLDMPCGIVVHKEYEYITLMPKKSKKEVPVQYPFKVGTTNIPDIGKIIVKKTKVKTPQLNALLVDGDKIPANAVWRTRKEGDFIEKFGGGMKKVKSYLSDKKVPARIRKSLPMLAVGGEVLVIANLEISESLRVTENTENALLIKFDMENWV